MNRNTIRHLSHLPLAIAMALLCLALAGCASAAPAARSADSPTAVASANGANPAAGTPSENLAAITWTDEALALFQAEVPKMVQKIAKKEMEKQARLAGRTVIDREFYEEQKAKQGR